MLDKMVREDLRLGVLFEKVRLAKLMRQEVDDLIEPAMRPQVHAGPIEDAGFILLVKSSAIAAKLRQITPLLQERLQVRGYAITALKIKVLR